MGGRAYFVCITKHLCTRIPITVIAYMHGATLVLAEYCCLRIPPINISSGIGSNWVINNNFLYTISREERIHEGVDTCFCYYVIGEQKILEESHHAWHTTTHTTHRHSTGWWTIVGFRGIHHHAFSCR